MGKVLRAARSILVLAALVLLAACGSSSSNDVVRKPTDSVPATTGSTPTAPSSSATGAKNPVVRIVPRTGLRDGQIVLVRASGFSPHEALTVVQCAQKGDATGPGDCNLGAMKAVAADAAGTVQLQVKVAKGPFGTNKIVCSAKQACLISVTQASLSPTEEADQEITFAS